MSFNRPRCLTLSTCEREEAAALVSLVAGSLATTNEQARLKELDRIDFVSGDTLPRDTAAPVEIWIRPKGTRRQAFYRENNTSAWRSMSVVLADKALRTGKMPSGPMAGAAVVANESDNEPQHPLYAEFAARARSLNRQIDSLQTASRAPA